MYGSGRSTRTSSSASTISNRRFINIREVKREVESQNWLMTMASRTAGRGTLTFRSAFSFEPFTMRAVGSPQLLQTGETFKNRRLIDYQHPHDLFMALGSEYRRPVDDWMVRVGVDLVGAPSIGPPVFMHRPSAAENPQATLGHHNVDATHITHGVVKAGVERGIVGFEVSWFQGREPDEDRIGLDLDVPDSWAARLSWTIGPGSAQVSSAWLNEPEPLEPGDVTRLTASVGYTRTSGDRSTAIFVAWGQNREVFGVFDAYVAEATIRPNAKNAFYGRAEVVDKSILGGGVHIPGVVHRHPESRVGAFTVGYVRDLVVGRYGRLGLGADVTRYRIAENLKFLLRVTPLLPRVSSVSARALDVRSNVNGIRRGDPLASFSTAVAPFVAGTRPVVDWSTESRHRLPPVYTPSEAT